MSGMKHALNGNMAEYAKDALETESPWKRWRYDEGVGWYKCTAQPRWRTYVQYERMPKTIRIGDREVPAPYRGEMEDGQEYWVLDLTLPEKTIVSYWGGAEEDHRYMERGMIHLTKEAALETADALLVQLGAALKEQDK